MKKDNIQKLGYKKDSPYKNRKSINIKSNNITMSDVEIPLLLIPDGDNPIVAHPNSGEYHFPNSKQVKEIPMANTNLKKHLSSLSAKKQSELVDFLQSGGFTGQPNVEVEGGETVKLPDGKLEKFTGPKHSEGGIKTNLPDGSKVFSEYLTAPAEVVETILGKKSKKKYSYADLSKKFPTKPFEDIINNPTMDDIQKRSAALQLANHNAMLETIFTAQELDKEKSGKGNDGKMQKGGRLNFVGRVQNDEYLQRFKDNVQGGYPKEGNNTDNWQKLRSFDNGDSLVEYNVMYRDTNGKVQLSPQWALRDAKSGKYHPVDSFSAKEQLMKYQSGGAVMYPTDPLESIKREYPERTGEIPEVLIEALGLNKNDNGKKSKQNLRPLTEQELISQGLNLGQLPEILVEPAATFSTGVVRNLKPLISKEKSDITPTPMDRSKVGEPSNVYHPVVTGTDPSTLGSSPSHYTIDPGPINNNPAPTPPQPKPKPKPKVKSTPKPQVDNRFPELQPLPTEIHPVVGDGLGNDVQLSSYAWDENWKAPDRGEDDQNYNPDEVKADDKDYPGRKLNLKDFGISRQLSGSILDSLLAASQHLNVDNPQFRDNRKYPLFSRFVEIDTKEVSKQYNQAMQEILNSNMPEQVKQSRIAQLNSQMQDYQGKIDMANTERYQNKISQDTNKLQAYIDNNIDQSTRDIESFRQKVARVNDLKNSFMAKRKADIINPIRQFLDYSQQVGLQNQIYSDQYNLNPFTGKVKFTKGKSDPLKVQEEQLAQYAQNAKNSIDLGNGVKLVQTPVGYITVDESGKVTQLDTPKK